MDNKNSHLLNMLIASSASHVQLHAQTSKIQEILDSGEIILVDSGEIISVNHKREFDLDKDFSKIMQEQEERRIAKMNDGKKRLSEITEQDRGVKFVREKFTSPEIIQDDTYFTRKPKKPNTGIHIGSYKKQPKKPKNKLL